jgi:hypothetical protein
VTCPHALALKKRAKLFRRLIALRKEKHGGFGQRVPVLNKLAKKGAFRASLQAVHDEGQGLFCAQLLAEGKHHAFVFTVAPYELR